MKNKSPKTSVVIPTYNRAKLLPHSIESVLSQTFQDFELIIVDDGSIDKTEKVVKKFQKKDKRIFYYFQENKGPATTRNVGIKKAKGEYIAFLDSDDMWLSKKLEKQIRIFENSNNNELGCVFSYGIIRDIKND